MNKFHIIALVVLVGSIALRNQIGDTALTIGIGVGLILVIAGLFTMRRRA